MMVQDCVRSIQYLKHNYPLVAKAISKTGIESFRIKE
jgi:hypothetical protein